eukprot:TRINITY_DN113184_c0_g1_i1.p1 TRINITY_DN113184_c0_g1~~TRINITY_DN113184_c0_g1_i1.p1  ORF type:complete len:211 (-),score=29.75 TRINITY_DN113184_c0_g1_i1:242-874(-)
MSSSSCTIEDFGLTDRCFNCNTCEADTTLHQFTCPSCPGPSKEIGKGRLLLCLRCLNEEACTFCHRKPSPDDYVPEMPTPRESCAGTGGSAEQQSSSHTSNSQRLRELERQVAMLNLQQLELQQTTRLVNPEYVKVRLLMPNGDKKPMWFASEWTLAENLQEISTSYHELFDAYYEDCKVLDGIVFGKFHRQMMSSIDSDMLELKLVRRR